MKRSVSIATLFGVILVSAGCPAGFGPRPCSAKKEDAEILVIGDSILAFHAGSCASVPDVLADELDRPVRNAAKSGAKVSPGFGHVWGDIRNQYLQRDWDWVVVQGGVNDLNGACDCGECDEVIDSLISEDGAAGDVPQLVRQALDDGARVALMGYYDIPESAKWGFGRCGPWIDEIRARYARVAEAHDDVVFVDPAHAMNFTNAPDAYYRDGIHPSERGSELVGQLLAQTIRAAEAQ